MQEDKSDSDTTIQRAVNDSQIGAKQQDNSEKARSFLVYFSALLALLGFVAFLVTKDFRVLVGDSIFVVPVLVVYRYFFPIRERL